MAVAEEDVSRQGGEDLQMQGDGDEPNLPGSVVAVPPIWQNNDGSFRKVPEIPAPPPRKPPPLRNSTLSPWLLATRQQDREQAEADEQTAGGMMPAPQDYVPPSGGGTPRSGTGSAGGFSSSSISASIPYSMESRPEVDWEMLAEEEGSGVSLSQLEEFLAVKKGMRLACQTLPMTMTIWLVYVFLVINLGDSEGAFQSSNLIKETIESASGYRPGPDGNSSRTIQLHSLDEIEDVSWWLKTALLPVLDPDGPSMSRSQKMVGFARVTQLKGSIGDCAGISANLQQFYPGLCHPALPPGARVNDFGPFQQDDAFQALGTNRLPGEFEAWLDIGRPIAIVEDRVQNLITHAWIDKMTHEVLVDGFLLNLQTGVYSRLNLQIKLRREGGIEPILTVVPLRSKVVVHWSSVFINLVFLVLLIFQLVVFLQQAYAEHRLGLLKLHFMDPWTLLDVACILVSMTLSIMAVAYVLNTDAFSTMVSELGQMPEYDVLTAPAARKVQAIFENREYRFKVTVLFNTMANVLTLGRWVRFISAWYAVILCLRFYRGFTGQPRTAVILQAVLYMGNLFLHYMMVWGVVFGNFALSGYILFGEQVKAWSSIGGCVTTLLHILLGEFDYDELRNVAPLTAMVWWWAFFLSTTVVLSKCLTAAVLQRFLEVRQALGEPGIGLPAQIYTGIRNLWYQRSYEGSMKSTPDEDLLQMLAADLDPAHVKKLMQMKADRRLCTREDLAAAEKDKRVDVEFLVQRGMDPTSAQRLIDRTQQWAGNISMTSSATHRLMLMVARQMDFIHEEVERMQRKIRGRIDRAAQSADRVDVKHAKCLALAKRLKRAQKVPHGWTAHRDENGRRFLRHEESGLTSWTLPRALI